MLTIYRRGTGGQSLAGDEMPEDVIWVDLLNATEDEKRSVERLLGVEVPAEESLMEIEASSRLVSERGKLYLSAASVRMTDDGEAHLSPIGFILAPNALVTVRFAELPTFDAVSRRAAEGEMLQNGMCVFVALLAAMVERGADVLEHLGATIDSLSREVFRGGLAGGRRPVRSGRRLRESLQGVGVMAERLALARDVMLGVQRMASFVGEAGGDQLTPDAKRQLQSVAKDVASLADYETRLSDKIQLLLDAVLGFVNIAQNDLFKILTIVSVVGVPPTILVGVWGMNFKVMPELAWAWGYPLAWLAIIASAALPLVWFRWAGWFD
jgi:magnesium transporter